MDKVQIYYIVMFTLLQTVMGAKLIALMTERKSAESVGAFIGLLIGILLHLPVMGRILLWW